MTAAADLALARHPDEETRYRAVRRLDGREEAQLAELLARLGDESWRVRTMAVERISLLDDAGPALARLFELVDRAPSIDARAAAEWALAGLGAKALPALLARLEAGSPEQRLAAIAVVGAIGDRRGVDGLVGCLSAADTNVRSAAAEALGLIGGGAAAAALIGALASDDLGLRAAALEALTTLQVAPPLDRLAALLAEPTLRGAVFRLLGASDQPEAVRYLAGGLCDERASVRLAAFGALGRRRARSAHAALASLGDALDALAPDQPLAERAIEALSSGEPLVREGALVVLAHVGEARHAPALVRLADEDWLRPLVEEALLGLPPGAELLDLLGRSLPELGPLPRVTALAAMAGCGDPRALQGLLERSADPDPVVQAAALAALGRLGDPAAVAPLGRLLGGSAPEAGQAATALIRVAARGEAGRSAVLLECRARAAAGGSAALYRILGACGEGEDLRLVRLGLQARGMTERMAAAAAVATLGHRGLLKGEHVPELVAALSDAQWRVRVAAARAFRELADANAEARLGDPGEGEHPLCAEAMGELKRALGDPEPLVRAAALEALGACSQPESVASIEALAHDPSAPPAVLMAALVALARLSAGSGELVARALRHADAEVAKVAVAVAAQLPGEEGRTLLLEALADPRWDVRLEAAEGMARRGDPALRAAAGRAAATEADPLVARRLADAAWALGGRRDA